MASDPPSEDKETRRHQNQNMMGGMKLIRQELYGDNPIKAMKDLLAAQIQSQNAISQYLKAGGSLEEIIDVLDRSDDRKDFKVAAVVFDVAHHVILTCHSSFSHRLPKVESTCHRLIRTKAVYITNMLEGPQHPKYKKAALQLLTAMVILNPRLGREILATIDLNKHRTDQLAIPCKEDYENSVRISYVRFVLACFIDDDMILIKLVLQQRHMLFAISSGLVYDDVPTVELVLTTLLEKVVKNRQLTKSVKLYALNTVFLRSLLRLYQWLGPAHIVPTFWKKKRQKPSLATSAVDKEGKEIVREMVHTFLVAFLTDKQAGISHDPAVGTSPKRANDLAFSVLMSLTDYWEVQSVRDLAIAVLTACPDLVGHTLRRYEELLKLKVEETKSWIKYIEFVKKVISIQNEDSLTVNLSSDKLASVAVSLSAPLFVFSHIASSDCFSHENSCIRHEAVSMLMLCIRKLQKCVTVVQKIYPDKNSEAYKTFNRSITNYLDKRIFHLRDCEDIWSEEYTAIDSDDEQNKNIICWNHPDDVEYYSQLLDLFLEIVKLLPYRVNTILHDNENFAAEILEKAHECEDTRPECEEVNLFKIKCVKFICKMNAITDETFEEIIEIVMKQFNESAEAKTLLADVLLNTGFFDANKTEVYAWVSAFGTIKHQAVMTEATRVFVKSCSYVRSNIKTLCNTLNSIKESVSKSSDSSSSGVFDWSELVSLCEGENEDVSMDLSRYVHWIPTMNVSPLVPAFLLTIKENKTKTATKVLHDFINTILGFVLFNQVKPDGYYMLLKQISSKEIEDVVSFVSIWTTKVKKPKSSLTNDQLKGVLLKENTIELKVINDLLSSEDVTNDELLQYATDEIKVILLIKIIVFYTTRLVDRRPGIAQRAVRLLHVLLAEELPRPESDLQRKTHSSIMLCLKETVLHPVIIEKFKPLSETPDNLTSFAIFIISLIEDEREELTYNYRRIFVQDLISAMTQQVKISKTVLKNFKLFHLREQDVKLLTKHLLSQNSQGCRMLRSYLLTVAAENNYLLPDKTVESIAKVPKLQPALTEYFMKFPHQLARIKPDMLILNNQGAGFELAALLLKDEKSSSLLKMVLKIYKKNPKFVFLALAMVKDENAVKNLHMENIVAMQVDSLLDIILQTPHPDWLLSHKDRVAVLLDTCLDDVTSNKVCSYLIDKIHDISVAEVVVDITGPVFTKCRQSVALVQSLLALLVEKMKSDDLAACESLCLKLAKYVSVQTECDWSPVCTSWQWMEWSKLALKYGEDPELESAFLLAALSTSCAAIMKHNKQMVASLCEMVFSHSKFLRVILGHTKHKDELVGLLLTLLQIDSSTVVQDHIPIFLAAYGLTLSVLDQQIVKLFQICESNGIRFQKWKPYIWGEAAISHYSVYSVLQPTSLGNASSLLQCLEHLQQETVNNTITHFPCERSYTDTVAEDASVYDPAFYIPLFVSLLAPGELVRSYKFAQSGALALTVRALSLEDNKLRQAAYLVLSRYHNHLCIRPNKDQEIWLQFLNALRGGVMKLVQQEQKGNKHVVLPRLSSVVTVFFARACLILANPTMVMYPVITNYLLTKKYFNLTAVPEFLSLIHSNDVKQELHRNWILEVLRDGIHDADDLRLCLNSVALKFVMDLYSTITLPRISNIHLSHTEDQTATMKNSRTQILILEVIVSCTKSPENSKLLLDKYGLLAWLGGVIQCYKLTDALIPPIISILSSLIRYKAYTQYITELLFTLIREHHPSADQISHIVRVLHQYRTIVPFTEANVKELMEAVSSILDRQQLQNMQRCRNILIYGSAYQMCIEEPVEIISQLRDIVLLFASKHLRK